MGMRTCAAPSANGSRIVRHKQKFIGFCANTEGIGCTVCPVLASICLAQTVCEPYDSHVFAGLNTWLLYAGMPASAFISLRVYFMCLQMHFTCPRVYFMCLRVHFTCKCMSYTVVLCSAPTSCASLQLEMVSISTLWNSVRIKCLPNFGRSDIRLWFSDQSVICSIWISDNVMYGHSSAKAIFVCTYECWFKK